VVSLAARAVLLVLLCAVQTAGAAELRVELDETEVEWGRPLRGEVVYRGNGGDGGVDLTPWETRVHVERGFTSTDADPDGTPVRREQVRLYPRGPGGLSLPALSHGGARSEPVEVRVLPPRPEGQEIRLTTQVSAARVSAGEQVRVHLRLQTPDPRARVEIEPIADAALVSQVLPARKESLDGDAAVHETGWALFPLEPGMRSVRLPPVHYVLFGRTLHKLHLPLLQLEVEALPAYVPLTVPVGGVTVESALRAKDGARGWRVRLTTDGLLPAGMPEMESSLAGLAGVLPERLAREQREEVRPDGVYQVLEYRAPLPRWLAGLGPAPKIGLQVFDPDSRRVERVNHALPRAWNVPFWFVLSAAIIGLGLAGAAGWWLVRGWNRLSARRTLRAAIAAAPDAHALRRLLLAHAGRRSLGELAAAMGDDRSRAFAARLNTACFGRASESVERLRGDAVRLLARRHPWPRSARTPTGAALGRSRLSACAVDRGGISPSRRKR
jgi:hypothetical protein